MTLSICMIVKNEAANLAACIEPMKDLADEIIVVDTGSTDETRAIAEGLGARVFDFPWCEDFAAARNEAIRHASGDWILIIDADDRLVPSEQEKLRCLLASPGDADAYTMRCVVLTKDGRVGWEVEHVRLFRNDSKIRYQHRIHEQVVAAKRTLPTGIRLVHTGYVDQRVLPAKLERNLRLIDLDLAEHPLDGRLLYYRGATLFDLERIDEALVTLQLAEPLLDRRSEAGRWHALALARAYRAADRASDALDVLRAARFFVPSDVDLAVLEAQLLIELGDVGGAGSLLSGILDDTERDLTLQHIAGWTLLGEVHAALGQFEAAAAIGRRVTEKRPTWGDGWLLYADALLGLDMIDELGTATERLRTMRQTSDVCSMIDAARLARTGDREHALSALDSCTDPLAATLRERLRTWRSGPILSGLRQIAPERQTPTAMFASRPIDKFQDLPIEGANP